MLQFLKLQLGDLSLVFYLLLFCVCGSVATLSYLGGSQGLWLLVAILGILYAFFAGVGKLICFYFGIAYSLLYIYLSYGVGLYGDVMLNLFYLPINILGIVLWKENQNAKQNRVLIRSLPLPAFFGILLFVAVLSLIYGFVLEAFKGEFSYLNALTVVLQLIAFYLQVKRYVQNYALVTLANLIYIWIFWVIWQERSPEAIAQFLNMIVFLGIGIYYWWLWSKEYRLQEAERRQE